MLFQNPDDLPIEQNRCRRRFVGEQKGGEQDDNQDRDEKPRHRHSDATLNVVANV
jgi:hypothetical protein